MVHSENYGISEYVKHRLLDVKAMAVKLKDKQGPNLGVFKLHLNFTSLIWLQKTKQML